MQREHADAAQRSGRWRWYLLAAYLALLAASHAVRLAGAGQEVRAKETVATLQVVDEDSVAAERFALAYDEYPGPEAAPVLVLIDGSPDAPVSLKPLAEALSDSFRVLLPDLPGFGQASEDLPDYSFRAQGQYLVQWMAALDIDRAHLMAYSQGGGVALEAAAIAPARIASVGMISAAGVPEVELLGSYMLNNAVRGMQVAASWLLHEATPHFGLLDADVFDVAYARTLYDSDQRTLRERLAAYTRPMLVLHGDADRRIPMAAAREHARLVPQSRLIPLTGDHQIVETQPEVVESAIARFVRSVEAGTALVRAEAPPVRRAASVRPFDPQSVPRAEGMMLIVVLLLLAVATLVSEDLACVGAGLLVAQGMLGFWPAVVGCFIGILGGDVFLFLLGRHVGQPVLRSPLLAWMINDDALERGSRWIRHRGPAVIIASRFIPGTRMPTYVSAGMLGMRMRTFLLYFLSVSILWTPVLVGLADLGGTQMIAWLEGYQELALPVVAGVVALVAGCTLWVRGR